MTSRSYYCRLVNQLDTVLRELATLDENFQVTWKCDIAFEWYLHGTYYVYTVPYIHTLEL